jgi:phosphinothricin acetyltransferase
MENMHQPTIHRAKGGDLPGVLKILNHYVVNHHCTFDTRPWSVEQKQEWFDQFSHEGRYRLLVARSGDRLLGYAHSCRWRPKNAYDITVETTVYVHPEHKSRGLGHALLQRLLDELEGTGVHSAVAGIAQPNEASNRLHERLGYQSVGTFQRAGLKFNNYWDVTWYQKMF